MEMGRDGQKGSGFETGVPLKYERGLDRRGVLRPPA